MYARENIATITLKPDVLNVEPEDRSCESGALNLWHLI